ncbi:unnamed protein product [Nippostrongylus brasiliensis]|uniref:Uncharacterized protein n=1 Tax=Nippostrongylus brasiliensis TaxID=27835 RepID=A0A0N4YYP6_NIPBR|nr:unnamed protein product [Nippostrongylus brasiliensis]
MRRRRRSRRPPMKKWPCGIAALHAYKRRSRSRSDERNRTRRHSRTRSPCRREDKAAGRVIT